MLKGDFANLSERKLMDCLNRLGYDIEIKVKPTKLALSHLTWPFLEHVKRIRKRQPSQKKKRNDQEDSSPG